ncbi:MAG: flagellar basal body P-ring formation chaperone FlgA [Betaproteobacteria bacterium]|nr:flagellar basal body P-ring formation chaperone FlgA [Betaproteobacteria bacterium]
MPLQRRLFAVPLCLMLALWQAPPALAAAPEPHAAIRQAVRDYVRAHAAQLPGTVKLSVGTIDPRLELPRCAHLKAFVPVGGRLWGNSSVGVRCLSPDWSLYVPVDVQVFAPVVVAARPLPQGQVISPGDVTLRKEDLSQLPNGVLSDPAQPVGRILTYGVPAGYALRLDILRAPLVIHLGQNVTLAATGQGFTVTSQGRALANAAVGQPVPVRVPSGSIITGIATGQGTVAVAY